METIVNMASKLSEFIGICLLDLSLTFYFLSCIFSEYLCLRQVHLGLKQWPYAAISIVFKLLIILYVMTVITLCMFFGIVDVV